MFELFAVFWFNALLYVCLALVFWAGFYSATYDDALEAGWWQIGALCHLGWHKAALCHQGATRVAGVIEYSWYSFPSA